MEGEGRVRAVEAAKARCPRGGESSTTCAENRTIFERKCAAFSAKFQRLSRAHVSRAQIYTNFVTCRPR